MSRDFGFNRKDVLVIPTNQEVLPRVDSLKASLKGLSGILNVASASVLPIKTSNERAVIPEGMGREEALTMDVFDVGYDFTEVLDIRVTQGRSFSRDYADETELIINQTALKQLGWTEPLGKRLTLGEESGAVVGVVRDFQFRNMITQTPPTVLVLKPGQSRYLFVRIDPTHTAASLMPLIKDRWDALAPGIPLESFLLEHYFADAYADINHAGLMMRAVGVGSILFSCLGMLGLVSFVLSKKTKEIGIRKTMGASAGSIFKKLMREFVMLVVLANLIAQPLAYILLTRFMQTGYAFSADISLAGFLLVAALSILFTGLVIFHQVSKAARQNPVHSLRYE
jgi:putative ABC transport system permease protein